jgi:malonyl-CoA decarboxylase
MMEAGPALCRLIHSRLNMTDPQNTDPQTPALHNPVEHVEPALSPAGAESWLANSWLDQLWSSLAARGRRFITLPRADLPRLARAQQLAEALLSGRGEASGAALAEALHAAIDDLTAEDKLAFILFLSVNFGPEPARLREAAESYLAHPSPKTAALLAEIANPPRQELLRRMNMAPGGTAALIAMRCDVLEHLASEPSLRPLEADLRHLLTSWFNRGFLELRRIDWRTPAFILEKLIAYEAVHEVQGWEDLRRRLAPDRRCFGFFHPSLPDEPLIFVEVALVRGLADAVQPLLDRKGDERAFRIHEHDADTAIFYSISNCQVGLRNISFGNFLIKQVVDELQAELPHLRQFATLSPVPGLRHAIEAWLDMPPAGRTPLMLSAEERAQLLQAASMVPEPVEDQQSDHHEITALETALAIPFWWQREDVSHALKPVLLRLTALYLTGGFGAALRADSVARFHLGNGARLESINWLANPGMRGLSESFGIMVNYLYDPKAIEANHEAFQRSGAVARAPFVDALMAPAQAPSKWLPRLGRGRAG